MNKMFWKKNGSTILTVAGATGVVATTVLAVKATPKALKRIEEAETEKGKALTKMEVVKAAGPAYIPTVLVGMGSIACIVGIDVLGKRQQASLMSAYALLDSSYKEYKEKVKVLHGEEGEKAVRAEIAKDHYKEEAQPEDDGKQLFFDEYSKRYFRATNETILSAEYAINKTLADDSYATLNELYDLFGLDKIDTGDDIGWSSSQMYEMYWSAWIEFYHEKVVQEDGMECYVIHYTDPSVDYAEY